MSTQFDLGTARGEIRIDTTSLDQARAKSAALATSMQASMKSVGTSLASAGKSMTLKFTLPIVAGLGFAVKEFNEAARVAADVESAIDSTGGAANVTGKQIQDLATRVRDYSGVSDEAVASGAAMLLTFVNIRNEVGAGNDIFNQSVEILADLSVKFGQDASQAAIKLGKALNDPIKGMTALSRVGVLFTDQQKEQIKTLVENNDILSAQKIILGELNVEFGKSAEAQGKTPWGQTQIALGQVGDQFERLGALVAPVLASLARGLKSFIDFITNLPGPVKTALGVFVGFLAVLGPIIFLIGKLVSGIGALITAYAAVKVAMAAMTGQVLVTTAAVAGLEAKTAATAATMGSAFARILAALGPVGIGIAAIGIGIGAAFFASRRASQQAIENARRWGRTLVQEATKGKRAILELDAAFLKAVEEIGRGEESVELFRTANQGLAQAFREGEINAGEAVVQFEDLINKARNAGGVYQEWARTQTDGADATEFARQRVTDLAESMFQAGSITRSEFISALVTLGDTYEMANTKANIVATGIDKVGTKVDITGKKIESFAGMTIKEFDEWRKNVVGSLKSATPALDQLSGRAKITTESIITSFRRQQRVFESYSENLITFLDLNIPEGLKNQIIDMGLEGAPVIEGFNDLTKQELREVAQSFRAGQRAIGETSDPLAELASDADHSAGRVDNLGNSLGTIQRKYGNLQLNVTTNFRESGTPPPDWFHKGLQFGGTVPFNQLAIVGERGPELVFLPRGASVLESEKTLKLLRQMSSSSESRVVGGSAGPSEMLVVFELDGEVIHKTVSLRERETRIRLGSRG